MMIRGKVPIVQEADSRTGAFGRLQDSLSKIKTAAGLGPSVFSAFAERHEGAV
jgi:hypothetical protein